MLKNKLKSLIAVAIAGAMFLLAGCGGGTDPKENSSAQQAQPKIGSVALRINPEISVSYNKDGLVTSLQGKNDDGRKVVESYKDFIGKPAAEVMADLVKLIDAEGYFIEETETNKQNLILELEAKSMVPDSEFLPNLEDSVDDALKSLNRTNVVTLIDADDWDDAYSKEGERSPYITLDKATEIALKQAGIRADAASFDDKEYDLEDGRPIYELEFFADGVAYELDIDARTGNIIKYEIDRDRDDINADGRQDRDDSDVDDHYDRDDHDDDWDDDDDDDERDWEAVDDDDRYDRDDDWDDDDDDDRLPAPSVAPAPAPTTTQPRPVPVPTYDGDDDDDWDDVNDNDDDDDDDDDDDWDDVNDNDDDDDDDD
ncbi:MAG TPA: hypothetical protein GX717_09600 [Clostridiaceae bacterium]|nr:hypothetical protein [Clostridiaceae bacterium]